MKSIRIKSLVRVIVLLAWTIRLFSACGSSKNADITFVDVKGVEIPSGGEIDINDPLMIRLSNLEPSSYYRVRLLDPTGERFYSEDLVFISDDNGELPDSAVVFLGSDAKNQVNTRIVDMKSFFSLGTSWLGKELSPGEWCVNVYEYRGGTVTGKRCIDVADSARKVYTTDSAGTPGKSFLLNVSNLYLSGENFTQDESFDLYILENSGKFLSDGEEILDSRGSSKTTGTVTSGDGTFSLPLWSTPSLLGLFDVVVDLNQNGIWDEGTDLISYAGYLPGFSIQNRGVTTFTNNLQLACAIYGGNYCTFKDFFLEEDIYFWANPQSQPATPFDAPSPKLYIVDHKDSWTTWATEADNLVNSFEEIIKFPAQVGSYSTGRVLFLPKGLVTNGEINPGCYDLILDTNIDGKYEIGQDYLDNKDLEGNATCGFSVPGGDGAPEVSFASAIDGDGASIGDGGSTTSTVLSLQGGVTAESSIISSYVTIETETQFNQISFTFSGTGFDTKQFPLFNGLNRVTVYFMDDAKRTGYARISLTSDQSAIHRAIEVQLTWTVPTGATASDMDLHLVKPDGVYYNLQDDCYWATCKPPLILEWGAEVVVDPPADDLFNNPVLAVDCVSDCVRFESLYIEDRTDALLGDYNLYVNAYNGKGNPTIKIFINGDPDPVNQVFSPEGVSCLPLPLESSTATATWNPGYFTISDGAITFTKVDTCSP